MNFFRYWQIRFYTIWSLFFECHRKCLLWDSLSSCIDWYGPWKHPFGPQNDLSYVCCRPRQYSQGFFLSGFRNQTTLDLLALSFFSVTLHPRRVKLLGAPGINPSFLVLQATVSTIKPASSSKDHFLVVCNFETPPTSFFMPKKNLEAKLHRCNRRRNFFWHEQKFKFGANFFFGWWAATQKKLNFFPVQKLINAFVAF